MHLHTSDSKNSHNVAQALAGLSQASTLSLANADFLTLIQSAKTEGTDDEREGGKEKRKFEITSASVCVCVCICVPVFGASA